ncbi:MAG TPA: STAS domain-containing protein [Bryobacteraceae bacterium]|nr:STAS domain-containing protein [Bryobacteraceae bacterium]
MMGIEPINDFRVRVTEAEGRIVICVEGELSLSTAGPLHRALIQALAAGQDTLLDLVGLKSIDLCGLQLLCAAHRTYVSRGVRFDLQGMEHGVSEVARTAGFAARNLVCPNRPDGNCLWRNL